MSSVHNRQGWHQRIKHRISSILHTVRPPRPSRSAGHTDDERRVGTSSAPHLRVGDRKKRPANKVQRVKGQSDRHPPEHSEKASEKAAEKTTSRPKRRPMTARNESAPISPVTARSKSIDRHMFSDIARTPGSSSSTRYRTSENLLVHTNDGYDASPESYSPTSTRVAEDHHMYSKPQGDERPRNRFSYLSLRHWRQNRPAPGASTSTLASSIYPYTPDPASPPRTSDEAPSIGGRFSPVVFARRASSWGEPGDYEDVLSLNSGGEEDPLERDAVMLGAGGISNDPAYGNVIPIGYSTAAAAAAGAAVPLVLRQPQPERLLIGTPVPTTSDSVVYDPSLTRQARDRAQTTSPSPLAHNIVYDGQYDDDSDDDSLSYGEVVDRSQYHGGGYADVGASSSSIDEEADEDSDESIPLEVRRRRPSVAVTAASPPPPSP